MMKWNPNPLIAITGITLTGAPIYAQAKIYVSVEQAQKLIFPNKQFTKYPSGIDRGYSRQNAVGI
jgi:hypothetical protein